MNNEQTIPPLRLLFWESTSRCNLSCVHCRRQDTSAEAAKDDLSTDQAKALMTSVAGMARGTGISCGAGVPPAPRCIFVFSGGEPLLRPDWEELATFARERGLMTALATNGTLIDARVADRVAAVGFHRVSVSLDGADAATHDAFRSADGAFDRAMAGVAALRRAGVSVQINATISRHNLRQLDALHALAREQGAVAMHLFLLVPVGCGAKIETTHQLPAVDYERVLNWLCDRQADLTAAGDRFELKATCAPHYIRVASMRAAKRGAGGCLCGSAVAFVSHRGQVFPCGYLPIECGLVCETDFATIWRDSPIFAALRQPGNRGGKCGRCEFNPRCGGCRARAFAATGDYMAEEPFCGWRVT